MFVDMKIDEQMLGAAPYEDPDEEIDIAIGRQDVDGEADLGI